MLFSANLRDARRHAGVMQTDVANTIHSSQWFVGATKCREQTVRLPTLVRLAYAVNADPGALLFIDRAVDYSTETLVKPVGALHAHLPAALGEQRGNLTEGERLTPSAAPSCQLYVEDAPEV